MPRSFRSSVQLPNLDRERLHAAIDPRLVDGIAFYDQLKLAHWNVKGPGFKPFHTFLGEIASQVDDVNDRLAERLIALGGVALATSKAVAETNTLPAMPTEPETRAMPLLRMIADSFDVYLRGLQTLNVVAAQVNGGAGDAGTVNLLGDVLEGLEKTQWQLLSHLEDGG